MSAGKGIVFSKKVVSMVIDSKLATGMVVDGTRRGWLWAKGRWKLTNDDERQSIGGGFLSSQNQTRRRCKRSIWWIVKVRRQARRLWMEGGWKLQSHRGGREGCKTRREPGRRGESGECREVGEDALSDSKTLQSAGKDRQVVHLAFCHRYLPNLDYATSTLISPRRLLHDLGHLEQSHLRQLPVSFF